MHELSLALEVINLAQREADSRGIMSVREIVIEVGELSGVEADAFLSALELLGRDSILGRAKIQIVRTPGTGFCLACDLKFKMFNRLDQCPGCHRFPSEITGGEEFRVVSMSVEEPISSP